MRHKIYSISELKKQGAAINNSVLYFNNETFKLGPRIRKNCLDAVEKYCDYCSTKKLEFIIIEDEVYLTVWKQDQVSNSRLDALENSNGTFVNHVEANLELGKEELKVHQSDEILTPEFLDQCRQSLLLTVGPIANIIFDDTLANVHILNREQFIEELAKRIPEKNLVDIFFQNCKT